VTTVRHAPDCKANQRDSLNDAGRALLNHLIGAADERG
jgi:hypothetical protein